MNRYAIIVAGGSGSRMGSVIPKQFILIAGKPLLMHTIEKFANQVPGVNIIIALPGLFIQLWLDLCKEFAFSIAHSVVTGGKSRAGSVKNSLDGIIEKEALVAVHDGVRPFINKETIETGFRLASEYGAAIPVLEMNDSVRMVDNGLNHPVERNKLRSVQTPQCFRLSLLREAYKISGIESFTDDASLVESLGHKIHLFEGNKENIKITTTFDLLVAEAIISKQETGNLQY
ncbi:MAG: 2-C-methyl-D-erythritol 4-phosphate cytidylyltransferase [Lentimicrobium sp.]